METGTGMEKAVQRGWNRTRNGEREGTVRAGLAVEEEGEKAYIGRGCAGVWGESMQGRETIRFGTYNIRNVRNVGLESALRGISQANMDLEIFQETKLTGGVYTRRPSGYSVVTTDAPSRHRGRVAVFYRPSTQYVVESAQ